MVIESVDKLPCWHLTQWQLTRLTNDASDSFPGRQRNGWQWPEGGVDLVAHFELFFLRMSDNPAPATAGAAPPKKRQREASVL